jgi:hypothetical protein
MSLQFGHGFLFSGGLHRWDRLLRQLLLPICLEPLWEQGRPCRKADQISISQAGF